MDELDELSTCRGLALDRTASLNRADKPEPELPASADGGPPNLHPAPAHCGLGSLETPGGTW